MDGRNYLNAYYIGDERFENDEEGQHAHNFNEYPPYVEREVEIVDDPNPNPNEQVQGAYFDDGNLNEEGEIGAQENGELNPNEEAFIIDENDPNMMFAMQNEHMLTVKGVDIYELDPNMIAALQNPMEEPRAVNPGEVDWTFIYLDQMIKKSNALIYMVTDKLCQVEIVIKSRRYDEDARRIARIIKPKSLNIVRMQLLETTRAAFDEADYHVDVQVMQEISDAIQINNDAHFEIDGYKIFHLGPACIGFDKRLTVFLPQKLQILCAHETIRNNLHGISVDDFCNLIHVCIGSLSPTDLPYPKALVVLKLWRRFADDETEVHEGVLRLYDYNYFPNLAMRCFGEIHTRFPQPPPRIIHPRTFNVAYDIRKPFDHIVEENGFDFNRDAHVILYHSEPPGFVSFALWIKHTTQKYSEHTLFEYPLTVRVTAENNGVRLERQPTISRKLRKNYRSMGCPNLFSLHDLAKLAGHPNNYLVRLTVEIRYETNKSAFNRSVEADFRELTELGFFTNPDAMPADRLNSPETRKLLDILIHGTIEMSEDEFRLILELAQLIGCERAKEYCCRAFTTKHRIIANRPNLGGLFQEFHNLPNELNNQDYIEDHIRACEWAVQHATVDIYGDHMYYDWSQDLDSVWQGHRLQI